MLEHLSTLQPESLLDIGAGYGKWGFLAREMLDWNSGRLAPEAWRVRIDAIEVFGYESPLLDWVYDDVQRANVLDCQAELAGYDLVIMSDVIEHLPKSDALGLLRELVSRNRNVLVSTPIDFFDQEIAANPYERHVSHWEASDFNDFVYDLDIAGGAALVVLLAGAGARIPTASYRRVNRILDRVPYLRRHGGVRRAVKRPMIRHLTADAHQRS
jgi:hypothetical protein